MPSVLETEVSEKKRRRRFTAAEKLRILALADKATKPGELGALLRSEGLYSSHLTAWRKARAEGSLRGLAPRRRGPAPRVVDGRDREIAELKKKLAKQERELEKARLINELQKKVSQLLGIALPTASETDEERS